MLINAMRDAMVQSFTNSMENPNGMADLTPTELMTLLQLADDQQMFTANRG